MKTFGKRFKELRKDKKLTQYELEKQFNKQFNTTFNKSTISQYENDKRKPEINILENWADFFDVSVDYLLCRTDERLSVEADILRTFKKQRAALKKSTETKNEQLLISIYKELNDIGKKEAIKRINELTEINKYTTPVTIAAHNDDTDDNQLKLMQEDIDEL